ncbi:hypothetical protein TrVE_jg3528 [Triparma verrucosa]|uniref:Glycosyltransferase 2-like domain-containing protein n=1 Tax=Triparma verrucosa TaxID=1606542 RepID=A0A9W7BC67_9STRA|nr:hypothetical protein TrVE_jg3528 [Triparma verrucosa]
MPRPFRLLTGLILFAVLTSLITLLNFHNFIASATSITSDLEIAVISATNRKWSTSNVYHNFKRQKWRNKKLIVMGEDDSPEWEDIQRRDSRVTYFYQRNHRGEELSTGLKIKAALNRVNEDSLVAIFDDDDFYAKDYLTFMEGQLRKEGADLVKLQNWDFFDGVPIEGLPNYKGTKLVGEFWELDLKIATEHQAIFGYGFTYFFKRSVALKGKFATKHGRSGWDSTWTQSLEDLGFNLKPVRGKPHIVIKIQHGSNASLQMVQYVRKADPPPYSVLKEMLAESLEVTAPEVELGGCQELAELIRGSPSHHKVGRNKSKRSKPIDPRELITLHFLIASSPDSCCNLCLSTHGCVTSDFHDSRCFFKGRAEFAAPWKAEQILYNQEKKTMATAAT